MCLLTMIKRPPLTPTGLQMTVYVSQHTDACETEVCLSRIAEQATIDGVLYKSSMFLGCQMVHTQPTLYIASYPDYHLSPIS
jgi:hypothetical protein